MIKILIIICFYGNYFCSHFPISKNNAIEYDLRKLEEKVALGKSMTSEEASVYFSLKLVAQGKTGQYGTIIWVMIGLSNYISNAIVPIIQPHISKLLLKYKFKKMLKYIKEKYSLDGIAGYDGIKNIIKSIIDIMKKQKNTKELQKNDGILLYGPPGCGKTNFVKTIAQEAGIPIVTILMKDLVNEQGLIIEKLDVLFKVLKESIIKNGPCILFFEELDFLVGNRVGHDLSINESLMLQNFLSILDDQSLKGLFLIACTNYKEKIDEALLRSGKFGIHIEIGKPNLEDIIALCEIYNKKLNLNIDIASTAKEYLGYSVSEIIKLIEKQKSKI
jgi:SpoVK/Ycf46/Vps4 family AAA+-type ATPase